MTDTSEYYAVYVGSQLSLLSLFLGLPQSHAPYAASLVTTPHVIPLIGLACYVGGQTFLHSAAFSRCEDAMEISDLLAKAKALPLPQRRRVAAIMGSLVADAAGKHTRLIQAHVGVCNRVYM